MQNVSRNRAIVIVGFMGCGKSAVARVLAECLDCPMVDLDHLITQREGRTPGQIIAEAGEPEFRAAETRTLGELLGNGFAGVLAVGGGAWIEAANRRLLSENGALTIWVDAPFELCWQRIQSANDFRPLAPTKERAMMLFNSRRATYALAKVQVETGAYETVEALAARVLEMLPLSDEP